MSAYPPSPKSDLAIDQWVKFTDCVRIRIENGKKVYGDSSFDRPLESLVEEIRQEIEDVCGWAFIMWSRLNELERSMQTLKERS